VLFPVLLLWLLLRFDALGCACAGCQAATVFVLITTGVVPHCDDVQVMVCGRACGALGCTAVRLGDGAVMLLARRVHSAQCSGVFVVLDG
jgi:hypothetical protein